MRRIGVRRGRLTLHGVRPCGQINQRLVQVPAAGHDVGKRRATHEGRVITGAMQRLLHTIAKAHHLVGCRQGVGGAEDGFDLARAELDLQRPQRQAQALRGVAHDGQGLIGLVGPALSQQVVAGVDHRHPGRLAGPGGQGRVEAILVDAVDVEFDLQATAQAVARRGQARQCLLQHMARIDGHGAAVGKVRLGAQPAGVGRPGQATQAARVGQQHQVVGKAKAGQVIQRTRLEHGVSRAVRAVLEQHGADQPQAVAQGVGHGIKGWLRWPLTSRVMRCGVCRQRSHQGLAAQRTVQVTPGDAHLLQAQLTHLRQGAFAGRGAGQAVCAAALGEGAHGALLGATSDCSHAAPARLARAASRQNDSH